MGEVDKSLGADRLVVRVPFLPVSAASTPSEDIPPVKNAALPASCVRLSARPRLSLSKLRSAPMVPGGRLATIST